MIKILETTLNDRYKTYAVATSRQAVGLKEVPNGSEFNINGFVKVHIVKDNPKEGDTDIEFDSIVLIGEDGQLYATRSKSVMQTINDLKALSEGEDENELVKQGITLIKTTGRTSNNRDFIQVSLKV